MELIKIICLNEPDLSYTHNTVLVKGEYYIGQYEEADVGSGDTGYGVCPLYKVYDMDKNYLGEYYARDFQTLVKYRNNKLEEILREEEVS